MADQTRAIVHTATEVERHQPRLLTPIADIGEIIANHGVIAAVIQKALKINTDYGVIPGTGKKDADGNETGKPTLLKAGAERLLISFGTYADYEIMTQEADHDRVVTWSKRKKVWTNAFKGDRSFTSEEETGQVLGLYRSVVKAVIKQRGTDEVVGSGIGVCSTLEAKYCDRPRDCENTVLKMAQKRALVGAVLNTFGLSDRFTQDVEDLPADVLDPHSPPGAHARRPDPAPPAVEPHYAQTVKAIKARLMDPNRGNFDLKEFNALIKKHVTGRDDTEGLAGFYTRVMAGEWDDPFHEDRSEPEIIVTATSTVSVDELFEKLGIAMATRGFTDKQQEYVFVKYGAGESEGEVLANLKAAGMKVTVDGWTPSAEEIEN